MKLVFITQMLKYGCTESHHYILGVYSTKAEAELAGEVEKTWRGYAYEPNVIEMELDKPMPGVKTLNHWMAEA